MFSNTIPSSPWRQKERNLHRLTQLSFRTVVKATESHIRAPVPRMAPPCTSQILLFSMTQSDKLRNMHRMQFFASIFALAKILYLIHYTVYGFSTKAPIYVCNSHRISQRVLFGVQFHVKYIPGTSKRNQSTSGMMPIGQLQRIFHLFLSYSNLLALETLHSLAYVNIWTKQWQAGATTTATVRGSLFHLKLLQVRIKFHIQGIVSRIIIFQYIFFYNPHDLYISHGPAQRNIKKCIGETGQYQKRKKTRDTQQI